MTANMAGWGGVPDLGLDRVLDLGVAAVRRRTIRRRLGYALLLVAGPGAVIALGSLWPAVMLGDLGHFSPTRSSIALGFMGAAVILSLAGTITMIRSGSNPLDNRDPSRHLARADRTWLRARVAAGAPVAPAQQAVAEEAADWLARQPGTVPCYLAMGLMGVGLVLSDSGALNLVIGLGLVVEGAVLSVISVVRATTARRWLSFYSTEPTWDQS